MRVYISADIEGVAGVVTRAHLGPEGFEYEWARATMTEEVNAAIRGARAAGAGEIVVSDSHGNGQNILPDRLEPDVTLVRSWPRPLGMMEGVDAGEYACALFVGYHAGASNPRGCLSHTWSSRVLSALRLNGRDASETWISAAIAGHFGVPIALVTGDDVYVEEAKAMLGDVGGVVTKYSLGTMSARCRRPKDVQEDIAGAAREAVGRAGALRPLRIGTPVAVDIDMRSRMAAELLSYLPWIERRGTLGVRFEAQDMIAVSKMLGFLTTYQPDL